HRGPRAGLAHHRRAQARRRRGHHPRPRPLGRHRARRRRPPRDDAPRAGRSPRLHRPSGFPCRAPPRARRHSPLPPLVSRQRLVTLLWICLGGALGTAARYGMQTWAKQAIGGAFPWGTLAVNVIGSFFIGAVMYVALNTHVITETVRLTL